MRLDRALLSSPANGGLRLTPPVMALPLELPKPLDFSRGLSASPLETSSEFLLRAAERSDVDELATLCTDSFFGTHELADGPIIFMQRLMILMRVRKQLARRVGFEEEDRECRLFVAEDERSGRLIGCLDLAVHVYDRDQQRFYLTVDTLPPTPGGPLGPFERSKYAWRPYLASVAVAKEERRRGVARRLVVEAELVAKQWGYNELFLEVAQSNEAALGFYRRTGYRKVKAWKRGTAGAGAQVVTNTGFSWEISRADKYVMQKPLLFPRLMRSELE